MSCSCTLNSGPTLVPIRWSHKSCSLAKKKNHTFTEQRKNIYTLISGRQSGPPVSECVRASFHTAKLRRSAGGARRKLSHYFGRVRRATCSSKWSTFERCWNAGADRFWQVTVFGEAGSGPGGLPRQSYVNRMGKAWFRDVVYDHGEAALLSVRLAIKTGHLIGILQKWCSSIFSV